ncbi:MAG: S1 RNA-binding domain-containing protein, partial [Chloroflexi bacterium]|nr:S1 RNA-binding domain-containing protein [Chloroflexota bacterium]
MTQTQNAQPVQVPEEVNTQETEQLEHLMETEMAQAYAYQALEHGQILDGTIISISPTEILIDVGSKSEGIVSSRELEQLGQEYLSNLSVGDAVLAYVVRPEDRHGNIILSLARAQQERDWREAERLFEAQESFEAKITGCNRGGLIVEMGQVSGFAPGSQLVIQHHDEKPSETRGAGRWSHLVGKQLLFKIIELDRDRNRLILSERLAMREWRRQEKERLLSELRRGDIRKGVVTSLTDFGAFVDLGGADGLIHLSELSWGQIQHSREVLEVGQEVEVYVLKVERERRRIGLSLRQLQPEPWSVVHETYAVGQLVEGTITKLTDFGAFASVGPGIEGLIHISEMAEHRITHPREVVKRGDVLTMRIIRIEPQRRRIALSLRQAPEDQYVEFDWREEIPGEEEEEDFVEEIIVEEAEAEPVDVEEAKAEPMAEEAEAEP